VPAARRAGEQVGLTFLALVLLWWNLVHLGIMVSKTPDNDFSKGWYSTVAFLQGGEMYGYNDSIPAHFTPDTPTNLWNLNPPHFHLLMLPFALMPLMKGLMAWVLFNFLLLFVGLRWLSRELGLTPKQRQWALLAFLAFNGTHATFLCGHCSYLLLLAVLGMWTAARRGRWVRAGLWLGAGMSVKPFLFIVLPYLLLKRRWGALAAAFGSMMLCYAAGVAVFGVHNHLEWLSKFRDTGGWSWLFFNGSLFGLFSRTLTANPEAVPLLECSPRVVTALWLLVGVPVGLVTLAVARADPSRAGTDRAMALLLTAAMLLSPLGWAYYYCLPLGPVAMVAMRWWRDREASSPWSRRLIAAAGVMFLWPLLHAGVFQPALWSTLVLGNLFGYATILVWAALVIDGIRAYRRRRERQGPASRREQVAVADDRVPRPQHVFDEDAVLVEGVGS
jgi:hypothetical protein